jgi:hypothetical protein
MAVIAKSSDAMLRLLWGSNEMAVVFMKLYIAQSL